MVVIGLGPLEEGEWRGGCRDGRVEEVRTIGTPLAVPLSPTSTTVISITPSSRLAGHCNPTCVPPSTSDDERLDASEGHAQVNTAASAAAVSNVVPLGSSVIVQATMTTTTTGVGATCVCGVG